MVAVLWFRARSVFGATRWRDRPFGAAALARDRANQSFGMRCEAYVRLLGTDERRFAYRAQMGNHQRERRYAARSIAPFCNQFQRVPRGAPGSSGTRAHFAAELSF